MSGPIGKTFAATSDGYDAADIRKRTKAVLIGSIGNLIEWYDIYAYSAFALYFCRRFFSRRRTRSRSNWRRPRYSRRRFWCARSEAPYLAISPIGMGGAMR